MNTNDFEMPAIISPKYITSPITNLFVKEFTPQLNPSEEEYNALELAMKTIDELIYYCQETEPVGALMLTGEWGCGKTHLIEHELREELYDSHIIVRISLFGIGSVEEINNNVKREWIAQCNDVLSKIQNHKKAVTVGKTIFGGVLSLIPNLKEIKNNILSINVLDFITIRSEVDKKRVVLVFDDLERSRLSTIDVLGCINDYCENYHFNTIIVANEGKITNNTNNGTISYSEIKEKIIARTVCYKPEFSSIINSLLQKREWFNKEYKQFLNDNEKLILSLFETDLVIKENEEDEKTAAVLQKPHNIRSLKCGLQDFHRVYDKLVAFEISDKSAFLYSFLACVMTSKTGKNVKAEAINSGIVGDLKKIYPLFDSTTLLNNIKNWIIYGDWNEEFLDEELTMYVEQNKAAEPKDVLRYNRFMELDEEYIKTGFSGLLYDCYEGVFNLNDYVLFIENSCWSRKYSIELPEAIDWDKVISGIHVCFKRNIKQYDLENYTLRVIGEDSRNHFTEDELKAYDLIAEFRHNNVVVYENNKMNYISMLQKNGLEAFKKCRLKVFNAFDIDMATATFESFRDSSQTDKVYFPGYFNGMWKTVIDSHGIDLESTKSGLKKLADELRELKEQYISNGKNIASVHTETFIEVISKLLSQIDERIGASTTEIVK